MATCNQCGAFVTNDFIRVFGTNHGTVYACIDCTSNTELVNGKAAVIDQKPTSEK